jgi:transglutaminase-like putative cysteine protease
MIYALRHETSYDYTRPVDLSVHMIHLTPLRLPWQQVISCALTADPAPSRLRSERDCFGNTTHWMFLDSPHPKFRAVLEAVVSVNAPPPPAHEATPAWEIVVAAARAGGAYGYEAAEFLGTSTMVKPFADATAYVAQSFSPARPALAGLFDLTLRIRRDFAFRAGVTEIGTPLSQVLAQKAGVCQDFAHLMIAGLRGLGLPARYASGYIRTRPPKHGVRRRGADQSHAWVSCWLGPAHGWIDLDPTNGLIIADEHVVLAYGRDYADISPLAGVILGGGAHRVQVSVDLEPVETAEAAR